MKNHSIIAYVFSAFFSILILELNAQIGGTDFHVARETGEAELAYIYNDVQDFAKKNEDGEVEGILIDLMNEFEAYVSNKYSINISTQFIQVEEQNFNKFLETVESSNGGVFGLSNTSITEKRKSMFQFSPSYIDNISVLITHNSISTINSLSEMENRFSEMKAVSVPSSTYLEKLEYLRSVYFPEMVIELVSSGQEVIELVANEPNYFAVVDLLYYLEFYKKGAPIKRHKAGDEPGDQFGILMPRSNDWKPIIDEFFHSGFIQSKKYRLIISNHLGASATKLISTQSKL